MAAVDFLREQTDILVLRRKNDPVPLQGPKVAGRGQGRGPRIRRDAGVVDIEYFTDASDAGVFDTETLGRVGGKNEGTILDGESDAIATARQTKMAERRKIRPAAVGDISAVAEIHLRVAARKAQNIGPADGV